MKEKLSQSERKRAAIIEAAIEEFREKGFHAASMDAISARAGVSKRTVYNHFVSKEALFQAIVQRLFQHSLKVTQLAYSPQQPLADQLQAFALRELELLRCDEFRALARMVIVEFMLSESLADEAMAQLGEQGMGLELWMKAAMEDNRLQQVDTGYAAAQFLGLIKAVAFWPQLLMRQPVPDEAMAVRIAEDAVTMFLSRYTVA
ncbi:TetR/AcrR family transcriptional regulator [Marinobacterium jannaschii]|uniref:TetR/AcrR family transcriptional regulator n=1 Tax=Marinobacterium jannaschii TaxID=64970 RepID=UPI000488D7CD|nr:TetR/AcrR family transcriptional regulator [Marinobacterium jannaschii]